ncbi:hypothetical protein K469DRAFT_684222 [Zopfia rhizophila CBS 207.26]|uniref:Uncharacterized protein n=1 Tax=Zopfia rhizophila CBS 207.26 TaxID=1314779 RepID=A0A6A6EAR1_9PEZI|nr:hypothetical protein K469DRAFT_684222 [Zopfia rhizophila CBS 207.26]
MRISILPTLFLPALSACHVIHPKPQPAQARANAIIPRSTATAIPDLVLSDFQIDPPAPTSTQTPENLDLRLRAPKPEPEIVADPNAGGIPSNPNANPSGPAQAVAGESITVQWVETLIHGSKTWVPVTATIRFEAVPLQAPQPGKGVVGMGTLTGEVGAVRTIEVGAAGTLGAGWKGMAVGLGVGAMGALV